MSAKSTLFDLFNEFDVAQGFAPIRARSRMLKIADMNDRNISSNPRLQILRQEVEETVLGLFRLHGWSANIVREIDIDDCIEIVAKRKLVETRIAVLYSGNGISNARYKELGNEVSHIFFRGNSHLLDSSASGVGVPVEPLRDFFAYLVGLNRRVDPDRTPKVIPPKPKSMLRLTAENPLDAVIARLQQFTSITLAQKLVERRAETESHTLNTETIESKAIGIAYSIRGALEYVVLTRQDALNRRVLGLYYGVMALAQAEMLASPCGATDLQQVEGMTRQGHGLYTLQLPPGGFADLRVGVLRNGFFAKWMRFLGHVTSSYPEARPKTPADLGATPTGTYCSLGGLFASMPEIDDLFAEVFGNPPGWISVAYDQRANSQRTASRSVSSMVGSTYGLFHDRSGKVPGARLESAGWPLAEIQRVDYHPGPGTAFRARVDHGGHDLWWSVLPTHSSPFGDRPTLIFPTVGGVSEYRAIAAATLYALSIMVRYLPSAWRRIEGGDEDQYLALVNAALSVWERLLPQHFLESIAGESVRTAQPGSWLA